MSATGVVSRQLNGSFVASGTLYRFESTIMILFGSPALSFTSMNPCPPPPPFSMTTMNGCFVRWCFAAMPWIRRAIWSAPPPAPPVTTKVIGFVGSHAAHTEVLTHNIPARSPAPQGVNHAIRRSAILSIHIPPVLPAFHLQCPSLPLPHDIPDVRRNASSSERREVGDGLYAGARQAIVTARYSGSHDNHALANRP